MVRNITTYILIGLMLVLAGCRSGQSSVLPEEGEITLDFTTGDFGTRATEDGNKYGDIHENLILSLTAVFFDHTTGANLWTYKSDETHAGAFSLSFQVAEIPDAVKNATGGLDIHLFANLPADLDLTGKTLTEVRAIQVTPNPSLRETNGVAPRSSLIMSGRLENVTYTDALARSTFGTVELKRRVAKVRVRLLPNSEIESHKPANTPPEDTFWGKPEVAFIGYAVSGFLIPAGGVVVPDRETFEDVEDINDLYHPMTTIYDVVQEGASYLEYRNEYPFYTLPLTWENDLTLAPEVLLRVPLLNPVDYPDADARTTVDHTEHDKATYYYYRIPFANFKELETEKTLAGNTLYELSVRVYKLGSTESTKPETIPGDARVLPWTEERETLVDIETDRRFLYVSPMTAEMYGRELRLQFSVSAGDVFSSDNISVSGYYHTYDGINGNRSTELVTTFGSVSLKALDSNGNVVSGDNRTSGEIVLSLSDSQVPEHNSPIFLTMRVRSEGTPQMERTVNITYYPDIIVERELDIRGDDVQNPNMYIFRVANYSPTTDYIVGYPGGNDEAPGPEDDNTVSPYFILNIWNFDDSGSTDDKVASWDEARRYCEGISETYIDDTTGQNVTLTGWRLPTEKEIQIIYDRTKKSPGTINRTTLDNTTGLQPYWDYYNDNTGDRNLRVRCVKDLEKPIIIKG